MIDRRPYPVSGAWRPGEDPGLRRFLAIAVDRPFALDRGGRLTDVDIAYETLGRAGRHGLQRRPRLPRAGPATATLAGPAGRGHPTPGWWEGVVGPGLPIDTDRYFVVCANVLGGCQGSTGPASPDPATGRPYGSTFPVVTIRDMVRVQARLADHLGDRALAVACSAARWAACRCSSGAIMYPERVRVARRHRHVRAGHGAADRVGCDRPAVDPARPALAGRRLLRRRARRRPPRGAGHRPHGGPGDVPVRQRVHRPVRPRAGRARRTTSSACGSASRSSATSTTTATSSSAASTPTATWCSARPWTSTTSARGRGGLESAMARDAGCPTLVLGITSDMLYPIYQQRQIHRAPRPPRDADRATSRSTPPTATTPS